MDESPTTIDQQAGPRPEDEVLATVERFRRGWLDGHAPRIEDYLARAPGSDQPALLPALVAAEVGLRRARGEAIDADAYARRFPGSGEAVRAAIGAAGAAPAPDPAAAAPAPPIGPSVPGYEILGILGRGGMGVVYKARQVGLGRTVALKMILAGAHAAPDELARFRAEAEAVARLQHPGVVQVHEVGEAGGCPYFSLEFVGGGTLAEALEGRPLPPRRAATLAGGLAEAVDHAHRRGIVHRDLKPANVLLTMDGEPKVTDFGIAKLAGAAGRTRTGAIMGTLGYMAPEQAAGDSAEAGPAADIHAVGAILYEMLTGRPPYRGRTPRETLTLTCSHPPEPPGRVRPGLPRDLETICLKCLRKDPADRYPDAAALAAELRSFLAGEAIRARPPGWRHRASEWARRRPLGMALAAVLGAGVLGLAAGAARVDALATGVAAALALGAGGSWYAWRLRRSVAELGRQKAASERQVERVHLVLEMTRRLMAAADADELLRRIGETATRLADADRATIFLVDRDRGEVHSRVALGDGVEEIRVPLGRGIAGAVAATGETTLLTDCYSDPRFNPAIDRKTGYRTRNLLAVPMRDGRGRVVGVMQVLNRRGPAYEPDDLEVIEALAASAAVAVGRIGAADRPPAAPPREAMPPEDPEATRAR